MGSITALFARKLIDAAGTGIDRAALLSLAGLEPGDSSATRMIPDSVYYDLLEAIAAQLGDATAFPLRVGASMRCDDYGAFGLAWKTAPTLRASFERAARYARLLTSVTRYEVRNHPSGAIFVLHREGARRLGLRLSNEATLASVVTISREVAPGPLVPQEAHFRHPAPSEITAHRAFFGGRLVFGSDLDGLLYARGDLDRGNRLGDAALSRFLVPHLDREMAAVAADDRFADRLQRRISDRLSDGPPRAADLARDMGVSGRTLHRRLAQDGTSFQRVLETARRRLAEGLLADSDHSIAEIAFLTGFAEQSSFTRAFKRWAGRTPAAFRDRPAAR